MMIVMSHSKCLWTWLHGHICCSSLWAGSLCVCGRLSGVSQQRSLPSALCKHLPSQCESLALTPSLYPAVTSLAGAWQTVPVLALYFLYCNTHLISHCKKPCHSQNFPPLIPLLQQSLNHLPFIRLLQQPYHFLNYPLLISLLQQPYRRVEDQMWPTRGWVTPLKT